MLRSLWLVGLSAQFVEEWGENKDQKGNTDTDGQIVMKALSLGICDPLISMLDMIAANVAPATAPAIVREVLYRAPAIAESSGRARETMRAGGVPR
ncbi:hypothetical protein QV65_07170 [Rhodococcus erythropolis]|nr:hypothetical protein QV65_07170 [Rhodococcus erythropolis]